MREHLKNDLNPYVCLFRDCGKPETLYSHSEQWLAHMKQHALRWTCNAKSHEPLTFLAKDKYEDHMKTRHRGAFSDAQLSAISERNARTFGPLFSSCPLCGIGLGDDGLPDTLEGHIVGHLRFLALKSLPLIEEELEDSDSSRSAASNDSAKPLDRSTLRDLLGHDSQLQYDSLQSNLQASIPFSSAGEPGDTNAFSPWGGLRHYIGNSSAQTLTRTSSEGMGDDAILIFQHPYRHWRDDDIRDILSVMFTFRGINTTSSKSHFSDPFNEVSLNSEMRLKRMLQLRIASFGPEGCPECGATDLVVSEDIARHLLLHGDPDWFVDPEDWLPDATNGNIREAQWGQVLEVSAEVYESEQDPILQHFLDQAQSARICSEQWAAKDGCDSLISALEDGALRCAESSKIFVPYDLLKSTLTTIRIEAALMEAGTDPDKIPELRKLVERYAHRIFATLLELHGLKHLPVLANYRFYDAALLQHRDDIWGLARVPTEDIPLAKFREASWKFRAPVFADDKFEYEVNEESPLAFVQWERHSSCNAYSQVYKAELHPAHMTVAPRVSVLLN